MRTLNTTRSAPRRTAAASRAAAVAVSLMVVSAVLSSACFGSRTTVMAAFVPLEMPAPPPRVVEANNPEVPPPVSLPEEPAPSSPSSVRTAPTRPPVEAPRPVEPARTEGPVDVVKPPDDALKVPTTTLQTTTSQQQGELERRIRGLLAQAANSLSRVNYQALNIDGRTQYDAAKGFVSQAEEAIRAKNLVFANNLADKAAALAAQLSPR